MQPCNRTLPLEAQYLYRRGLEMMDQQQEGRAVAYLRQAVFLAPGFSGARSALGTCLARLGREDEAAPYLGNTARIDGAGVCSSGSVSLGCFRTTAPPVTGSPLMFLAWQGRG